MHRFMFRRSALLLSPSFSEIVDRLDAFEKEFIELKAFQKAVEATSPQVAQAAKTNLKESLKEVKANKANLENPLTPKEFVALNQFYAKQKVKNVPFENLMYITSLSDLQQHARVVYREYLVRIAQLARHLNSAPYGLSQMDGIQKLKKWYQWSFHDMQNTPYPENKDGCYRYDRMVRRVFLRHYNVSSLLSEGMIELGRREGWTGVNEELIESYSDLEDFFTTFFVGRVRVRFLVSNYMYLSTKILDVKRKETEHFDPDGLTVPLFFDHNPNDFVGLICKTCSLLTIAKCAIKEAQKGYDEEIELKVAGDSNLHFVGIPYIMYDIIFAVLEDAVQANLDRQELMGVPSSKIEVTLAQHPSNERFVMRVSDTAGGLPLRDSAHLLSCWSIYNKMNDFNEDNIRTWTCSPIRLPYAYCAAQTIGGGLSVASIEGYGTDRQLYFPSTGICGLSI